ncbi:hypothetical protein AAZX31_12G198100 [Glycine max]|uniref:Seed biotin-containing protein SBP65 n=1 Tax=Glycine max TaxID=3847 RepID=K7LW58_SOYBN|nr:seed biotin-containing protein SBP65 [Glycine max]KAG4981303.1 hypothetical protein JHK85_035261 [Glycine max]KAG4986924.1 hypothetical protein JHK86_034615 [Glycine max]KAG5120124.1 hypothetical protein JHK82_034544 [Glycine max]KAG5141109.1 hypothetical protein JHK84_034877 [Glycine max]KAH1144199.1 hypothetical protein GYH30_034438 [Glycine max]|eukprot:XP_006592863.1 seed biotin-containing protein SBP65 [Glycine max]
MATQFEHLGKDTPQGSIEALQVGERVRETHELGAHFESLADKAPNVVGNKDNEIEARGGVRDVGKFEMKGNKDRQELEKRTREVIGREEKKKGRESGGQVVAEKGRGRVGPENEGARTTAVITCTLEKGGATQKPLREEESESTERSTWEQISNYSDQATQGVKERYDRAKQAASETLNTTAETAQEKSAQAKDLATQAKDATLEKGQQGYVATKDTISSAAKTASEKTAPVAEKAKEYTLQAAEKTKSVGGTTASYVGEKAVQAKDVTVESGKNAAGYAAKVAVDLKDKAASVGWAAAHFSAEKTVEGTKAAAHVVEGAAGYAGHKAAELASMSTGAVKGLAASAGETAKEYTTRKKEEAQRELEAKKAFQPQEAEERPSQGIGETVSSVGEKVKKPFENILGGEGKKDESGGNDQSSGGGQEQGKSIIGQTLTSIGEKLGDAKQREELIDNVTEGGSEVLGAVGETVGEIGQNTMKPAEIVQERAHVRQEGGVLDAIGETIAEIAETTRVMVAGEDKRVMPETRVTDRAKHEERSESA